VTTRISAQYLAGIALREQAEARKDAGLGRVVADSLRRLGEYLDVVARLATVDGALLIDDEIRPHRLRAHISADRWLGRVLEGSAYPRSSPRDMDVSSFGTRHNSAIAIAGRCPGLAVFVISEDGPVRAIMRVKGDVVIWPDCLNTVFLD
jgi:hypothetical protein